MNSKMVTVSVAPHQSDDPRRLTILLSEQLRKFGLCTLSCITAAVVHIHFTALFLLNVLAHCSPAGAPKDKLKWVKLRCKWMNVFSYQTGNLIARQIRKMDLLKGWSYKPVFNFWQFVSVHEFNATVEFFVICMLTCCDLRFTSECYSNFTVNGC